MSFLPFWVTRREARTRNLTNESNDRSLPTLDREETIEFLHEARRRRREKDKSMSFHLISCWLLLRFIRGSDFAASRGRTWFMEGSHHILVFLSLPPIRVGVHRATVSVWITNMIKPFKHLNERFNWHRSPIMLTHCSATNILSLMNSNVRCHAFVKRFSSIHAATKPGN